MNARVMIVDDERPIRESLQGLLEDEGYAVVCAASGEEAVARFRKQPVDCIVLDIWMPGIDGLETMNRLRQMDDDVPVIVMSGHATIDTAVRATRQGAYDFLEKPLSSERLLILLRNAVEKRRLELENVDLKQNMQMQSRQELIGVGTAIQGVRALLKRVAPTDTPVLLLGEHGTGKRVAARLLHAWSRRAEGAFIEVNTASIPEPRMESELFGHEKGAFTGALHTQRGRFEMAHHGSLYFDEVCELGLGTQAKVLRALQERTIQRLGNPSPLPADVRLIAASARDLDRELREEHLREDFYYRLNVVTVRMPPLRERIEDLPAIMDVLAAEQARILGGVAVRFSQEVIAIMQAYPWSGNLRELRNYIERCHILMPGEEITPENMLALDPFRQPSQPAAARGFDFSGNFHHARDHFERSFLLHHLERNDWNISRTAADIGMERSQLHRKIRAFGLTQSARKKE
ncbi:MAG TPA: sigma-54 dependent transcriptional regulator [Mariprofundaceae bacterium]|nr:sigma-54 dependent transcriptional regulator [Mariprofundaceae bacterium]